MECLGNFNNDWQFWKDGESIRQNVNLPHDAMIHEERDPDCENAHNSGFYPGGKYFYKKDWFADNDLADKKIFLKFGGVYRNSTVFINGTEAGYQPYGYSPFHIECSGFLKYGENNEIVVQVDNSATPSGRWYTGSGIYRPVSLIVKEQNHISLNGIKVRTLSIAPPRISVETNHNADAAMVEILSDGGVIASAEGNLVKVDLPNANLWSDETPVLYQCRVSVLRHGEVTDQEVVNFGIMKLEWSSNGLLLNGKEIKLRGACIHHDNGILGACAFKDAEERKVRLLKESGFNAIRSAHNPCSEYLLQAADKYGMLIMDEFTDVWYKPKQKNDYSLDFDGWYLKDLRAMVERDQNHPSVIMYSIGNEIGEVFEDRGIEITGKMIELCHSIDDSKPVTIGTNLMLCMMAARGSNAFAATDVNSKKKHKTKAGIEAGKSKKKKKLVGSELYNVLINILGNKMDKASAKKKCDTLTAAHFEKVDICGYNYGTIRYSLDKDLHPERIIVGSETRPPNIFENWKATINHSHVIGDFMWTGWDYLGEAGLAAVTYSASRNSGGVLLKKYPFLVGGAGVIDLCGNFLPEVWLNRAVWNTIGDNPYIGIEPLIYANEKAVYSMWRKTDAIHSWSWHGCEGDKADIIVYSNADTVELLFNGRSVGRKKVEECRTRFKTRYQPGELLAINYNADGREIGRDILKTADKKIHLSVRQDKTHLNANGQDLCHLEILLTDMNGEVIPSEDKQIQINIKGPGSLQGFGSAVPFTEETYIGNKHTTYMGRVLAVVRAGLSKGVISVEVSARGILPETVDIEVE